MVHWLGFDWRRRTATEPPVLRQRLLRLHVPRRRGADRSRPRLCGRAERRGDARQPRRLRHARHRQPVPRPHARPRTWRAFARCATASMPTARWCCAPRSTWPRPNINLRDPTLYRIKRATHHNTGDSWCIYPMYTYAHPIEDALENITHSICTLEFEDQRPFYDWVLERLAECGLLAQPLPQAVRVRAAEPDLRRHQQAQAAAAGRGRHRRRLGRPAHAHAGRHAPARLHAREPAPAGRAQRRQQGRRLDRLQLAGHRAARGPGHQGAARDGRARPAEAGAEQLGPGHRQGPDAALQRAAAPRPAGARACATSRSAPKCGSSARTSWKSR